MVSFAETRDFKDVPTKHWAKDSINDLVRLGITQGYPDGTFRGPKTISRYETAMFMAKLAQSVSEPTEDIDFAIEKLKNDLRVEIRALRAEIAQLKKQPEEETERPISGSFNSRIMFGNLFAGNTEVPGQNAPVGPKMNYRLKTTFAKSLGKGANIKVNLDTMDAGFNGGQGDFSTRILDVEGNMKINFFLADPIDIKVTVGPGTVVHTEEADANGHYIARSENNIVFQRPYSGISFSTKLGSLDTSLGYYARKLTNAGEIDVSHAKLSVKNYFGSFFFSDDIYLSSDIDVLSKDPQSNPSGPTDTKVTLYTGAKSGEKLKYDLILGFGKENDSLLGGLGVELDDMWNTNTNIKFSYRSVAKNYLYESAVLDEDIFSGVDYFGRLIGNGSGEGVVDFGFEVKQVMTETIDFILRADLRFSGDNSYGEDFPQSGSLYEMGLVYDIAPSTVLEGLYRIDNIPSAADKSTDLMQMSLLFTF